MGSEGRKRCQATCCSKEFASTKELWLHYHQMGVAGFENEPPSDVEASSTTESNGGATNGGEFAPPSRKKLGEEIGPVPHEAAASEQADRDLAVYSVCMDQPPNVVMVPCGHFF